MVPNPVDIVLALLVLLGAWSGWRRGFVASALGLAVLAASLVAALAGYRPVVALLEGVAPTLGVWLGPLAFLGIFLLAQLLLGSIAVAVTRRVPQRVHHGTANRLAGVAPGAVNGVIHAAVAAVLLVVLPLGPGMADRVRTSLLAPRLSAPAEWIETQLAPIVDPAVQRSLRAVTVQPESRQAIKLPTRVATARPAPELEARMLELVNAERDKAGLRPLRADPALTAVARDHSRDMFARGYFSHVSPEGADLGQRLRQARQGYLAAGENLALAPTLAGAHQGLMNSPGHRANILRPQFGRVGIGVLDGGIHGLMVTQNFRN